MPTSDGTTATRPRRSSSCATGSQLVGPTSGLWISTNADSRDAAATTAVCRRARADATRPDARGPSSSQPAAGYRPCLSPLLRGLDRHALDEVAAVAVDVQDLL